MSKASYQIQEVKSSKDLKKFLLLPDEIYQNHSNYIKPLHAHSKMMIGSLNEKEKHLFLAKKDDKVVARLAVKTHSHETESGIEKRLHYGFFECLESDPEATAALFDHAHTMYPDLSVTGPYHFRMEDPYIGNLVKGFDQEPYIFMPYNPEYYDEYLKKAGLNKAMDLFTYLAEITQCSEQIKRIAKRSERGGVTVRWLETARLKEEVQTVADIFNDSLSENWGFEPITDDQLDEMFMIFKYFIDPRMVCFAVKDGKEIGCLIFLPNLNPIIKTARGRLSPSFLWKLLTQKKSFKTARGYALGMRKGFHGTGIVCQIIEKIYARVIELDLTHVEISWVLENNKPMTAMSESTGGVHNKTYRIYEKPPLKASASPEPVH